MVDPISLIGISRAFSLFAPWLTVPALYGTSVNEAEYFCVTQHLYGSICKFIVFVHKPPNQTVVV